jgi:hypothetical protein
MASCHDRLLSNLLGLQGDNLCLKLNTLLLKLKGLFIGIKQVLEAVGNLKNSDFTLLVKLGSNPSTNRNRIRLDLRSFITGRFWHSTDSNLENPISQ